MTRSKLRGLIVLAVTAIALGVVLLFLAYRQVRGEFLGPTWRSFQIDTPAVALTFDDGPHPAFTKEVLALLAEKEVRATFFMLGEEIRRHPEIALAVAEAGHEIGNHAFEHDPLLAKSTSWVRDQIEMTDELIRSVGYEGPIWFRAPYAKQFASLPWVLWRDDRIQVLFDVRTKDTMTQDVDTIVENALDGVGPGSVILLHDGGSEHRSGTVAATAIIIDELRAQGFRLVTVGELLAFADVIPEDFLEASLQAE